MFSYITGSICFIYGVIVSYSSKKSMAEISNKKNKKIKRLDNIRDNIEIKHNGIDYNFIDYNNPNYIGIIPYRAEDITESMLNNPSDPDYIGHLFEEYRKKYDGSQFNL